MNDKNLLNENNQVTIAGEIISDFTYSHNVLGESFYEFRIAINRLSETIDIIPCLISERSFDVLKDNIGTYVKINGEFRSYNRYIEKLDKNVLVLTVFVRNIEIADKEDIKQNSKNNNNIILNGFICKDPIYRKTPLGREIADVLLAVNRSYGKTDYIPCVFWGRNAKFVSNLNVGDRLEVYGRIQSRKYVKKISDIESITKLAFEVSANLVYVKTKEE